MKLCFLLLIVAVACWFRGCDFNLNITVEVVPQSNVRSIPAFKSEPRVHLREGETL